MKVNKTLILLTALLSITFSNAQDSKGKKYQIHTVAFYNFENLFDTINGPNNDEEWLPTGSQNWTGRKYKKKLENLSRVISEIGTGEIQTNSPTLIGGSEIENRSVLEDLVKMPKLINKDYGIAHFDSPDKRGIDVALLYQKKHFKVTSMSNIPLLIYKKQEAKVDKKEKDEVTDDVITTSEKEERVYTRDQLLVTGFLDGEEINILVCHWPSRSGGEKKSAPFREAAGALSKKITDSLQKINPQAKLIILGDLNDGSFNKSVKVELGAKGKKEEVKPQGIYNPFESMAKKGLGTIAYRDAWDIFDIIMVTEPLIKDDYSSYRYWKAGIFNKPYLVQTTGQYKGYPLRHSANEEGFSDHFPVYIYLLKEVK